MIPSYQYITFIFILSSFFGFTQKTNTQEIDTLNTDLTFVEDSLPKKIRKKKNNLKIAKPYEPLAPARAAFYSAILPGLGQAYTGKYWKIPIVYAAIGTGVYVFLQNNENYNLLRDVYKRRLAGLPDEDVRFENLTNDRLIDLQRRYRRDQELALLVTVGLYLLNIVDANVSAHLQQYNITDDLSLRPTINLDDFQRKLHYGVSFNLKL